MANQLEVAMQQSTITLWQRGWSRRRIARDLGPDRGTVRGYVSSREAARCAGSKPAISTAGSEAGSECCEATPGSAERLTLAHLLALGLADAEEGYWGNMSVSEPPGAYMDRAEELLAAHPVLGDLAEEGRRRTLALSRSLP